MHLATRWEFEDIRLLAIRELEQLPLDEVAKILLSRQYDIVSPWVVEAYFKLCTRPEALDLKEASALGLDTTVRISQLREQLRSSSTRTISSPSGITSRRGSLPSAPSSSLRIESRRRPSTGNIEPYRVSTPRNMASTKASRRVGSPTRLVAEAFGLLEGSFGAREV